MVQLHTGGSRRSGVAPALLGILQRAQVVQWRAIPAVECLRALGCTCTKTGEQRRLHRREIYISTACTSTHTARSFNLRRPIREPPHHSPSSLHPLVHGTFYNIYFQTFQTILPSGVVSSCAEERGMEGKHRSVEARSPTPVAPSVLSLCSCLASDQ